MVLNLLHQYHIPTFTFWIAFHELCYLLTCLIKDAYVNGGLTSAFL